MPNQYLQRMTYTKELADVGQLSDASQLIRSEGEKNCCIPSHATNIENKHRRTISTPTTLKFHINRLNKKKKQI